MIREIVESDVPALFVVRPQTTDNGDGSYLIEGMLLHMRGFWQVFFDVIEKEGYSERASFDLEL